MDTQLTRRGKAVAALTVVCVLLAAVFGARSLNAVVAPGLVALAASVLVVRRSGTPTVKRTVPPDGHPDETHQATLAVEDCGPGHYELRDILGSGFRAAGGSHHVTETDRTIRYDVEYDHRGTHEFGPVRGTVTDVFGLASQSIRIDSVDEVLVYPRLVDPPTAVRSVLETVVDLERQPGRDEFDSLREYVRGDSPRDVHWKSSAKQPDDELVVKEFLGTTPTDSVRIAVDASGPRSSVDAAARAAASVAITLLDEGVEVGLETPDASVPANVGSDQRTAILATLARLRTGTPDGTDETIRISTDGDGALVHAGGHSVRFESGGAPSSITGGAESAPRTDERTEVAS
ncbi:DUF58 domain-containing protein [Salinarchaeum laminariae]|uniref:DUF58 domain-containing protein n=1 Tax=Salinarchaeum laminariae TaxID=869888 RepID=UPI0020C16849|nr:DUF58 domain-containing protein [Salinarchaeum laminariae]